MDAHVTDSAGTPAEPASPADDEPQAKTSGPGPDETAASERAGSTDADDRAEGGAGEGNGDAPRAGAAVPQPKRHVLRWAALGTSVVVLAAAGAGWWFYRKLDSNITTDITAAAELETYEKERPVPVVTDAQNILLLGSDTRSGKGNSKYGRDKPGSQRSDTTILLHIAADRQSATAMSIPRDLMVTVPSCGTSDGTRTREQFAQFNSAYELGGTACTVRTVERFTSIRIDHHMVMDFSGFKDMVNAVDGVEVCLKEPINDKAAHLNLAAGKQTLGGEEALGYVRARKSLGNGSDTDRMDRQQQFLGALVKKVQSNGVLLNPARLFPVLDAATKSITTDPGLNSLKDLYELTRAVRNVPTEKVQFLTVPRQPYRVDANRDELIEPEASLLFKALREDAPLAIVPADEKEDEKEVGGSAAPEPSTNPGSRDGKPDDSGPASPTPTPTFSGTNAAEGMCE
ncbi:LCP family protein [Streptomyces sp. NBC_01142]|uniref:LCP family protein n=1 Tax=Streptomyces sp. NBC_01142 TaxID=2975865 RepID=UPI002256CB27|nr:LCP family protein [Streptomyces sp. NBC_01142]MCX4823539.1 LCP family protein [Streptomyces sp. NBC_01142]